MIPCSNDARETFTDGERGDVEFGRDGGGLGGGGIIVPDDSLRDLSDACEFLILCSREALETTTEDERGDVAMGGGSDCEFEGGEDTSPVDSIRDFLDACEALKLCSNDALDTFTVGVGEDGDVVVGGAGGGLGGGVLLLLFLFPEPLAPPCPLLPLPPYLRPLAPCGLPMFDPL